MNKNRPKRLHEHVVDELGARIVHGALNAGDALPIEDDLASELGVSRTVVREAIKVLAQKNMLRVRTRIGTHVSPPATWNQLDPDILRWRFSGETDAKFVSDVIELRRIMEPAAAELAALRASPGALREIGHALAQMKMNDDVNAHIDADLRFHLAILEAAGNDLLLGLRHSIEGALNFAIHLSTRSKEDGSSSLALHAAVFDAIAARDPAAARAAMNLVVDRWSADSLRIVKASARKRKPQEKPRASSTALRSFRDGRKVTV